MSYDQLRHLADSYGLIAMGVMFLGLVGWTFRKGADAAHHHASQIIFDEEDSRHG